MNGSSALTKAEYEASLGELESVLADALRQDYRHAKLSESLDLSILTAADRKAVETLQDAHRTRINDICLEIEYFRETFRPVADYGTAC